MAPTIDDLRAARRELDGVIAEIRRIRGFESFLAPPRFEDIAAAASTPLVYVVPAERGGVALVIRGTDVTAVELSSLRADLLRDRVGRFREGYQAYAADRTAGLAPWTQALDETTAWLWDAMGPVVGAVGDASGATLVAGGLLGLLPLHAAWTPDASRPTGRFYALDALELCYAPNARALTAARQRAAKAAAAVVTIADPSPDPLPYAAVQELVTAAGFPGAATSIPAAAATPGGVLRALQQADVALLACHGFADLDQPLESGLVLRAGEGGEATTGSRGVLRLRDLLAVDLDLRLAILSACETSLPGTHLPDEVVALPTGLLQAGAAGVVASLWRVQSRPTTSLIAEFVRLWRFEHRSPSAALREAQQWVRDTTNEEKIRCYEKALDAGSPWLPEEAADRLLDDVSLLDPDDRTDGMVHRWAAFCYVGA